MLYVMHSAWVLGIAAVAQVIMWTVKFLLYLFDTDSSLERHCTGTESQDVGHTMPDAVLSPPKLFCIQAGSSTSHLNVLLVVMGRKTVSVYDKL